MKNKFLLKFLTVLSFIFVFSFCANAAVAGDINGNGVPDVDDARSALRVAIRLNAKDEYSSEQLDMTDYDYSGTTDVSDARLILRAAIKLDESKHYFSYDILTAPTCTSAGEYLRSCTECNNEQVFIQAVPALGHDLSVKEIKTPKTCDTDGVTIHKCSRCDYSTEEIIPGGHEWVEMTCTEPRHCVLCGLTEGTAPGHTVKVGYCANCNQYVDELESTALEIIACLNNGHRAINEAYKLMEDASKEDFTAPFFNKCEQSRSQFRSAYNDCYLKAYNLCGNEKEFKEAKTIIFSMMNEIYNSEGTGIYNQLLGINSENRMSVLIAVDEKVETLHQSENELKNYTTMWKR